MPQIRAGMGAGERCDTGTPRHSLNLCRRRNKGDTGDSQLRGGVTGRSFTFVEGFTRRGIGGGFSNAETNLLCV